MMDKIKRFVECTVPVTACNLKCRYCYVIQQGRRNKSIDEWMYSPEEIGKALTKERWGGTCLFSLTAPGETLLSPHIVSITKNILMQGHYVNITTNGTINKKFDEIASFPKALLERLHISFSFHYIELKNASLLKCYFDNIDKIRKTSCSYLVQINLCDEYMPYLNEIIMLCEEKVGAPPQVAVTRDVSEDKICLHTQQLDEEEYIQAAKAFDSPLFEFGMKNFLVKRKEFCYAGDWSFKFYLHTGILKCCYDSGGSQDIVKDHTKPIRFRAIGRNCGSPYCVNSTHFIALGVIPEIIAPSYSELRNRPEANWYTPNMSAFLGSRLSDTNKQYSGFRKFNINTIEYLRITVKTIIKRIVMVLR